MRFTEFFLCAVFLLLTAGCGSAPPAPDRITVTARDPAVGLSGTYLTVPFKLGLASSRDLRSAVFGDAASGGPASIVTDDKLNTAAFQVGAVKWTEKKALSVTQS